MYRDASLPRRSRLAPVANRFTFGDPVFGDCILRTSLLVVLIPCLLLVPQAARAASWYQFHTIADYHSLPKRNKPESLYAPAMNSSGQVVFMAANGEGASVIYQGKVGSLKKLVRNNKHSSQSPFLSLESHCSINDLGDIAFSGSINSGEGSAIVKFTQSSQTFTTIAEGSYNGSGSTPDLRHVSNPSINNAGQVVFKAQDMNLVNHAVEASGSSLSYLVDHLAAGNIYNPLVRVQSPTLDVVRYVAPAVPFAGIHKGDGVNTTSIAVSPTTLYEYVDDGFSISNPGAVSFIANPAGPVEQAVYVSWGGSGQNSQDPNPMKIADTNGAFESFDQTAVSLAGVAFNPTELKLPV